MGSGKRRTVFSGMSSCDRMSAARETLFPSLVSVSGQKIQSAACRAVKPFTVISSGSPGPRDTNMTGTFE